MLKMKKNFLTGQAVQDQKKLPSKGINCLSLEMSSRGWASSWAVYQALGTSSVRAGLDKDGLYDLSSTPKGPVDSVTLQSMIQRGQD